MRLIAFLIAILAATPATADICDDLWFTRNLIMDRAGYCFGTVLGQATFNNDNCTTKKVTLSRKDQALVRQLQDRERELKCRVDTKKYSAEMMDEVWRWIIQDLPVATEYESACNGWRLAPTPVFAARNTAAKVSGTIRPGDSLTMMHEWVDDWVYVIITEKVTHNVTGAGWILLDTGPEVCEGWAG